MISKPGPDTTVRTTRQRAAVADLLEEVREFRTAQEVHGLLRERGARIGLTTVYRTLQILATNGQLDVLRGADGEAAYRRCSSEHHHHLVCRGCAATVEIVMPVFENSCQSLARRYGYTQVTHVLEVFGLCGPCSAAAAQRPARGSGTTGRGAEHQ